jgi:hypothetical protein
LMLRPGMSGNVGGLKANEDALPAAPIADEAKTVDAPSPTAAAPIEVKNLRRVVASSIRGESDSDDIEPPMDYQPEWNIKSKLVLAWSSRLRRNGTRLKQPTCRSEKKFGAARWSRIIFAHLRERPLIPMGIRRARAVGCCHARIGTEGLLPSTERGRTICVARYIRVMRRTMKQLRPLVTGG